MVLLNKKIKDSILHIQLNDPESRNAFSPSMAEEFHKTLLENEFSALIVSASGPTFCSGGNLRFYKSLVTREEGLQHNRRITEILDHLSQVSWPKACYVNGACYGGGMELLSCFDWVSASPAALFGLWQRRIGLTFGWGGESRLKRRVNPATVDQWLLEGATLSAFDMKKAGLVQFIENHDEGLVRLENLMIKVLSHGEESLREILQAPNAQSQAFEKLWHSKKHKSILDSIKS